MWAHSPPATSRFFHLPDTSRLTAHLEPRPLIGIAQLAGVYLPRITLTFILEFIQTYLMQWTGQKVMFDLRSQIFRHIQRMHVGFFDRNPVGRLVTRVTSDVDALNEMFTSGVLAIFEDVFVLLFIVIIMLAMSWWLALITLAVHAGDSLRHAALPHLRARLLPPHPHRDRAHQRLHAGARKRHEHRPALQSRGARLPAIFPP